MFLPNRKFPVHVSDRFPERQIHWRDATGMPWSWRSAGFLDENPYSIGPPAEWDLTLDQGFWRCSLLEEEDRNILLIFAVSPAMLGGGIREPRQRGTLRPKCRFPQNESYGNSHEKCLFHRHQPTYQLVRIPIITRVGNVASTVISNPHIHTLLVLPTLDHRFPLCISTMQSPIVLPISVGTVINRQVLENQK